MTDKILIVEAAANPLGKLRDTLSARLNCVFAVGIEEAAVALRTEGPFAVVLADYRMPKRDGASFLAKVRDVQPRITRMLQVTQTELDAAFAALTDGTIFRFVMKPLSADTLVRHLEHAVQQHALQNAEEAFIQDTLRGAVQALCEALGMANPAASGRSQRIRALVQRLGKAVDIPHFWEVDMAAMLSHVGCVSLPSAILDKLARGKELEPAERRLFETHPTLGAALLANIPRMELVAKIIAEQLLPLSDGPCQGAQVLKVVQDYDTLSSRGMAAGAIFGQMRARPGVYADALLAGLESIIPPDEGYVRKRVTMRELKENMQLEEDIVSTDGMLLLARGSALNETNIYRLIEFKQTLEIVEPVSVLIPVAAT